MCISLAPDPWNGVWGSLHSLIEQLKLKCKNTFLVHILPLAITCIYCQVSNVCRRWIIINVARNKLTFECLKLRLTHVFDFKWRRGQPYRWLSGTNNWVRAHVGDVIIGWHNTHSKQHGAQRHLIPGYADWHRSEYWRNSGKISYEWKL